VAADGLALLVNQGRERNDVVSLHAKQRQPVPVVAKSGAILTFRRPPAKSLLFLTLSPVSDRNQFGTAAVMGIKDQQIDER
jgi:hypothetical protein